MAKQSTFITRNTLNDSEIQALRCLMNDALSILDSKKGATRRNTGNQDENLLNALRNKRDNSPPRDPPALSYENINPATIVEDFSKCQHELTVLKTENAHLKSELELVKAKFQSSELLVNKLKTHVEELIRTNKLLRGEGFDDIKQEIQHDSLVEDFGDADVSIGEQTQPNVLSELTQFSNPEYPDDAEEEDDLYEDPRFQTQLSNNLSSQLKSSPVKQPSSPVKIKEEHDTLNEDIENIDPSSVKRTFFQSPPKKRKRILITSSQEPIPHNIQQPFVLIDLSINPKTTLEWYPEDFKLVSGYDKIDNNYGQTIEKIPPNTQMYYKLQLDFIHDISTRKFNKLLDSQMEDSPFQHQKVNKRIPKWLITPPTTPEINLLDKRVLNEFKFEVNETNLKEYIHYYADITRTKRVKRWSIDQRPLEWSKSEFPSTQEHDQINALWDIKCQRLARLRLYHACFLVDEQSQQTGMWKFRDDKLNELVRQGQFVVDFNLFI